MHIFRAVNGINHLLLNASEQIIIQIVDFDRLIHNGLKLIANGRQWPGND